MILRYDEKRFFLKNKLSLCRLLKMCHKDPLSNEYKLKNAYKTI